jgi:hypothetical protein
MKGVILLIFLIYAGRHVHSQEKASANAPFTNVIVKKKKAGKICDTCIVDYALHALPEFSYVITGARHNYNGHRFNGLQRKDFISPDGRTGLSSTLHFISQRNIGISFLPTSLNEKGKTIPLYRNFRGEDYNKMEFSAEQNGSVIKQWTPLSALGEDRDYAILGTKTVSDQTISIPWKRTFFAGNFNLNVKDTLNIIVRHIGSKKIVQSIYIIRPVDKVTNFAYYQVRVTNDQPSLSIQDVLNMRSNTTGTIDYGGYSRVLEKEYTTIGVLRFLHLGENEEVEYSFGRPYRWKLARSLSSSDGVFIVLGNDMEAGKHHDIYLRYKSQPETIYKQTFRVKEKPPFEIPWGKVAVISILLLIVGSVIFYFWNERNKRKLAALKQKNEDIETRLSLLSGQLNPHFLFNSLNAIQGTINSSNPEKANTYIGNVAGFMRDVMDNGKKEFVSLQEELKLEEDYLKLEQERAAFFYTITVSTELDPSLVDFPPLLLQPVLENSIRHAFGQNLADPTITIQISRKDDNLNVEVSDNGNTFWDSDVLQDGYGLSLTRKRIAVYNEKLKGMSIQMEINYLQGSGTITTFIFHNWLE